MKMSDCLSLVVYWITGYRKDDVEDIAEPGQFVRSTHPKDRVIKVNPANHAAGHASPANQSSPFNQSRFAGQPPTNFGNHNSKYPNVRESQSQFTSHGDNTPMVLEDVDRF